MGFDGVGDDGQAVVAGECEGFAGEFEFAGGGVAQGLGGGGVELDVVGGPPGAEPFAAGRELTDQAGQAAIVGIAACFDAQGDDGVAGDDVPLGVEVEGTRVEHGESVWPHRRQERVSCPVEELKRRNVRLEVAMADELFDHLAAINERLAAQGIRAIDPANPSTSAHGSG